jgi:hypothetical protein
MPATHARTLGGCTRCSRRCSWSMVMIIAQSSFASCLLSSLLPPLFLRPPPAPPPRLSPDPVGVSHPPHPPTQGGPPNPHTPCWRPSPGATSNLSRQPACHIGKTPPLSQPTARRLPVPSYSCWACIRQSSLITLHHQPQTLTPPKVGNT